MRTADYTQKPRSMRDEFWAAVYRAAVLDPTVVVVTADMGAPGLDVFKKQFPHRYINVGIAEQQAVLAACGLAREGFKPFVYAIMPFITYRCYEQIKTVAGLMDIPITIVGVGSGFSYQESGPTHHSLEDITLLSLVPHMTVLNCSSPSMAEQVGEHAVHYGNKLKYVRLDREPVLDPVSGEHQRISPEDFSNGFIVHGNHPGNKVLLTTGTMIHQVIHDNTHRGVDAKVMEVFRFPFNTQAMLKCIGNAGEVYVVEENAEGSGLGPMVAQIAGGRTVRVKAVPTHSGYTYIYGGRGEILKHYGLTREDIEKWLNG